MTTEHKVSRKQLLHEPDEFLSLSQRVWFWAHENRGRAAAAVGGVAVLILAVVLGSALVRGAREKRAAELATAVGGYTGGTDATAAARLAGLADRLGASPGGALARYFAAGALAKDGDAAKAAEAFARAGREAGPESDLAPLARAAEGYLALGRGDRAGAEKIFAALVGDEGAVVPRAQLRLELAALYEAAGRVEDARRLCEEVERAHPDGPLGEAARARLAALGAGARAAS